jgi:anaerobic selenocysteine-containing dehydrogenase
MHLQDGADPDAVEWFETASILHSNGDALEIAVRDGRMVGVRGIGRSRVNHGRLGPKDLYGWQANASPDRLTRPLVRRGGELVETGWDEAMDLVVERSRALLQDRGPSALAFYGELVATVGACHAQTLRVMKWTLTRLKTAAPQVLAG